MHVIVPFLALMISADPMSSEDKLDIELLKQHQIELSADGLLAYFRQQTLDLTRLEQVRKSIAELGHTRFAVRERASKVLLTFGPPVRKLLEVAAVDDDPEVSKRARDLLKQLDDPKQIGIALAASRQLAKLKPDEATKVLIDFLPFAFDVIVFDEVLTTLVKLDQPVPLATIQSKEPSQRAAAGFVLGRSPKIELRKLILPLLTDADESVRLRTAQGLFAGRDREAIPALIALQIAKNGEVRWYAEEMLRRVAGESSPEPSADDTPDAHKAYRQAWETWWQRDGGKIDLAKIPDAPVQLGFTIGIEYNTDRVWEIGPDGKVRWDINAKGPMDAQVLPGNRVLIAESNGRMVSERDFKGTVLWSKEFPEEPINCQRLLNGQTFVGTRHGVTEVDAKGNVIKQFRISEDYLHAIRRLPNGGYLAITGKGEIRELDRTGKEMRRVTLVDEGRWGDVEALGNGRYLVANYGTGFIREVDAQGNKIWQIDIGGACGVERMPDGRYLVAVPNHMIILSKGGNKVWESPASNGSVRRAHRR